MKFYSRYPGDITIKTGHLSPAEFGAYDRLLDHYYATERPIEARRVYSVVRCQTAADRAATDAVLAEFWTLTEAGWVQDRADEVIAEARPRIEAARANGKKGGRPRKNPPGSPEKPSGFSEETHDEPGAKAIHKPESSPTSKTVSKASPSHPPAGGKGARFMEFWEAWPKSERKQDRAKCWEHWRAKGLDAIADQILADIRVKRGTTKWQDGFIEAPLVYLRGKRWEDGVQPDGGDGGSGVVDWTETRKGVEGKAAEVGMPAWTETEPFGAYRARVLRAAGVEPRKVA